MACSKHGPGVSPKRIVPPQPCGGGGGTDDISALALVYRPGGVTGGGVFETWQELYDQISSTRPRLVTVYVDTSIINPAPVPDGAAMPVAGWNMQGVTFFSTVNEATGALGELHFLEGAKFTNWTELGTIIRYTSESTQPVMTLGAGAHLVRVGVGVQVKMGNTGPFIRVDGGGLAAALTIPALFAAILEEPDPGDGPAFEVVGVNDVLQIIGGSFLQVSRNVFAGAGTVFIGIQPDSTVDPDQPSLVNPALIVLLGQASNVAYLPGVPGDWSPSPDDVAEALDQLAARVSGVTGRFFVDAIGEIAGSYLTISDAAAAWTALYGAGSMAALLLRGDQVHAWIGDLQGVGGLDLETDGTPENTLLNLTGFASEPVGATFLLTIQGVTLFGPSTLTIGDNYTLTLIDCSADTIGLAFAPATSNDLRATRTTIGGTSAVPAITSTGAVVCILDDCRINALNAAVFAMDVNGTVRTRNGGSTHWTIPGAGDRFMTDGTLDMQDQYELHADLAAGTTRTMFDAAAITAKGLDIFVNSDGGEGSAPPILQFGMTYTLTDGYSGRFRRGIYLPPAALDAADAVIDVVPNNWLAETPGQLGGNPAVVQASAGGFLRFNGSSQQWEGPGGAAVYEITTNASTLAALSVLDPLASEVYRVGTILGEVGTYKFSVEVVATRSMPGEGGGWSINGVCQMDNGGAMTILSQTVVADFENPLVYNPRVVASFLGDGITFAAESFDAVDTRWSFRVLSFVGRSQPV